ncbi:MAG: restriction endonuclease subunit S, partial [Lactiplantibacillus plantarum]
MSNKVPQIRFNGYSDDWEQRKLGEMAKEFKSGISLKAEYIYKFGKYPVYGGNGVRGYTNTYNHDGDFALIGRQGALSGNMNFSVGKAYFTEHAVAVKANDKNDTKFLFYLMTKLKLGKWVTQSAQPGLAVGTVVSIKVLVPNKNEQIKIANLFNDIDSTIALHQRKLDLLKEQKKGYLQKMFPKNGAKVPELRFAGFADDWEERKLQEVLRERNNQQPQSMEYPLVSFTVENGVTPKTDRYEREQLVVGDKSSKKYKVTVLNDIVYNPANLKFGAISRNKYGNAVFSPIYITFLVNNDVTTPEFIEMFVTRNDFIKRALKYQQGTVYERQSVSPTDLLAMNVYLPGKSEQEKIGSFFKQLDETIALHQRKLDLLKEQKKG